MAMSRKHYEELAKVFAGIANEAERAKIILDFSVMASQDNPRFNLDRFSKAVSVEVNARRDRIKGV